jgi:hypothetical protein
MPAGPAPPCLDVSLPFITGLVVMVLGYELSHPMSGYFFYLKKKSFFQNFNYTLFMEYSVIIQNMCTRSNDHIKVLTFPSQKDSGRLEDTRMKDRAPSWSPRK